MSSPEQISEFIVDATDTHIVYAGDGWFEIGTSSLNPGNFGPPFNGSSKGTYQANSSLSFTFEGTSIMAFGSTDLPMLNTTLSAVHHQPLCLIDGDVVGQVPITNEYGNNEILCGKTNLKHGTHRLQINVTESTGLVFDHLTFFSSRNDYRFIKRIGSMSGNVNYYLSWTRATVFGARGMMTDVMGSRASIDFTGAKLTWVGFLASDQLRGPMSGSYTVDHEPAISFDFTPSLSNITLYNQVLFTTPPLVPGPHNIVVTYHGSGSATGSSSPLVLDYLYVEPDSPSSDTIPTTTTSIFVTPATMTPSIFVTPATTTPTETSSEHPPPNHAGAIAGGVISGVIFMLFVLLLALLVKRRLRITQSRQEIPTTVTSATSPDLTSNPSHSIPLARISRPKRPSRKGRFGKSQSSNLSDAYGYNEATIEQTRAMKKGKKVQETRSEVGDGSEDVPLPAYSTS